MNGRERFVNGVLIDVILSNYSLQIVSARDQINYTSKTLKNFNLGLRSITAPRYLFIAPTPLCVQQHHPLTQGDTARIPPCAYSPVRECCLHLILRAMLAASSG